MSARPPGGDGGPPEDPPTGWDAVVDEVEAALDQAGVLGDATRQALLSALGEALSQLGDETEGEVQVQVHTLPSDDPDDPEGPPEVTVVDGGRSPNQPRSPKPRPELRVAEGGEEAEDEGGLPARVRVVRVGPGPGRRRTGLQHEGWIHVDADARQALYRGEQPHPYRIACARGRLALSVDGVTVETLGPGQSCDVVGRAVVVLAADEQPAAGSYARL